MLNSVLLVNKSDQPAEIPCPGIPTAYVAGFAAVPNCHIGNPCVQIKFHAESTPVIKSFYEVYFLLTNIEWEKPAAHVICSFMDSSG